MPFLSQRLRPPRPQPSGEPGFVLPLAISASLLLLLGSLSVQSAALQSRLSLVTREELRQQEDRMISVGRELVGGLNRSHPCLVGLPLASWPKEGSSCATPQALEAVQRGVWEGLAWRLVDWQPQPDAAELVLELDPASSTRAPRRAALAVLLRGEPLRAQSLRLLGLRGVAP
jgi:hypothetical protein